jgi:peptidoglycan/xylan/chitin deacetylase (PgdA/CDA1 family)
MPLLVALFACATAATTASAADQPAACNDQAALGVERIVEIDATEGPRLGHIQYKDIDFLEPGEVVLTFDDGPSRQSTPAVLEALAEHCTRATFFMVGRMAIADPDLVREVAARGHTVASHTFSHKNLASLSSSGAEREVELGVSAISAALGKPIAPFFRFPYLSDPRRVITHLEGRNQAIMSIDVDSYDWRARSRSIMHNNVLSQLDKKGKGIILFHDIQKVTSSSLGALLDELKRRKYRVVHIVPKTPAASLPAYDKMANEMLAKRQVAAAKSPLTTRAMVWPLAVKEPSAKTVARPPEQEKLPWSNADESTAADTPARRPAPRAAAARREPTLGQSQSAAARPAPQPRRAEPTLMELMFGPAAR